MIVECRIDDLLELAYDIAEPERVFLVDACEVVVETGRLELDGPAADGYADAHLDLHLSATPKGACSGSV